jgi:hypothetical protein
VPGCCHCFLHCARAHASAVCRVPRA